jgi:hypothetical protein
MKRIIPVALLICAALSAIAQSSIAPDYIVIQHAGSIGYFSGGAGYDIIKGRAHTSLHFGTVPKNQGGPLNIIAGKLVFVPWTVRLSDRAFFQPFNPGIMISYHMGDNFKLNVPNYFSDDNYYWWHTAMRLHVVAETALTFDVRSESLFNHITIYSEFNTNDLYLVSYFHNAETLNLHELIKLGIGVRVSF